MSTLGATSTPIDPSSTTDPAALLSIAWDAEPAMRLAERYAALDRLEALLATGSLPPAPPGRDWRLELVAERAIDAAANVRLAEGQALADRVLREADPAARLAIARASFARGRALAWIGTDEATRRADAVLIDAADRFRALGHTEWLGFTIFWRGNAVCFENGRLRDAATLMRDALDVIGPDSPRRSTILSFYADTLIELGDLDAAERVLDDATVLADRDRDPKSRAYAAWSRARATASRGDAAATERLLREVERGATDWFQMHGGIDFLADAAELLDRVGLTAEAADYLRRARERFARDAVQNVDRTDTTISIDVDCDPPVDESIEQAQATMIARGGDPWDGIDQLQRLVRLDWLEKRLVWRNTLLHAWAAYRASGPGTGADGAGALAARAFVQADACGGPAVIASGEAELARALAPLAHRSGSALAGDLLRADRTLIVRLFGPVTVTRADGSAIELPAGQPGQVVRMLAASPLGLPVEQVLETLFPDVAPAAGRQRLRQVLTRLRSVAGEIVVRDEQMLRLVPAWVDAVEFVGATDRVRRARGPLAARLAYGALALCDGPLLPGDPYSDWADELRSAVTLRQVTLLDLVAAEAGGRQSHREALAALVAAADLDPGDHRREQAIASLTRALGRDLPAGGSAGHGDRRDL